MIWVNRYILVDFRLINILQNRQPMTDAGDSHLLQLFVF